MRPEHEPPINTDIENVCVTFPLSIFCTYLCSVPTYLGEVEVSVVAEVMSAATAALLSISRHSFC